MARLSWHVIGGADPVLDGSNRLLAHDVPRAIKSRRQIRESQLKSKQVDCFAGIRLPELGKPLVMLI
jgi:hypothetical protein